MKSSAIMNKNVVDVEQPQTLADLERLLRRGSDFYAIITQALAEAILAAWNTSNRRIDQIRVQALKRDQASGRFLAGEQIGFGVFPDSVQLGDGQHRLMAQTASNTEQTYHVRIFNDEAEFMVFVATRDSGKNRTLADLFTILHVADGSGAAMAFERVTNAWQQFMGATPARLTRQERLDFAYKHVKEIRYVLTLPHRQFRAHVLAAIAIAYGKHPKAVAEFIAHVIDGSELAPGSPALVLSKAVNDLNAARGPKEKDRAMGLTLRAIHDGIRGKKKTAIRKAQLGATPVREAVVEFAGAEIANAWEARHGTRGSAK